MGKTLCSGVAAIEEVRSCFINQEWGGGGNERLKIGSEGAGNSHKQGEDGSLWPAISSGELGQKVMGRYLAGSEWFGGGSGKPKVHLLQ